MKRLQNILLISFVFIFAFTPVFSYSNNIGEVYANEEEKPSKKDKNKTKTEKEEETTEEKTEKEETSEKKKTEKTSDVEEKVEEEATSDAEEKVEKETTSEKEEKVEEETISDEEEKVEEETTSDTEKKEEEKTTSEKEETTTEVSSKSTVSPTHTVITDESVKTPKLNSNSAILMDAKSGAILYQKKADKKQYPASITKILTTLVALENAELDDKIKFKAKVLDAVEQDSSRIGVEAKEVISLEDSLYAVMLASANDVSAGVADQIGGSVKKFATMMNEKAKELGCTNSNFVNPHGLHSKKHYTTAYDMALITQAAIQNKDFCEISSALSHVIPKTKTTVEKRYLENHHKMLQDTEYYYEGIEYGKNGFTTKAGNTLVSVAKRGDLELICVVLKAEGFENTYKDTKKLFDYGFKNYQAIKPLETIDLNDKLLHTKFFQNKDVSQLPSLQASVDTDYTLVLPNTVSAENLSYNFYITPDDTTEVLGTIEILNGEEKLASVPISYEPPISKIQEKTQPEIIEIDQDDSFLTRNVKRLLAHKNLLAFLIASCVIVIIMIVGVYSIAGNNKRKKRKLK